MKQSNLKALFPEVWANNADAGTIRSIPLKDPGNGGASFEKGFSKVNMTPRAAGGIPPAGQDENGILNMLSIASQGREAGTAPPWNAAFAQSIGGYPQTAQICIVADGTPDILISIKDDNLDNPTDPNQTSWVSIKSGLQPKGDYAAASAGVPIGTIVMVSSYNIPDGWLQLVGQTFDKEEYPYLYDFMGTNVLPDYRGRFPRGCKGSSINVPEIGVQQGDATRAITGDIGALVSNPNSGNGCLANSSFSGIGKELESGGDLGWSHLEINSALSTPTDAENRPYAIISNFIIKAK